MEVSGRMCVSHALCPLSLAAIWMPELTQYLHCHCLPEKPHERERGGGGEGREGGGSLPANVFNMCVITCAG